MPILPPGVKAGKIGGAAAAGSKPGGVAKPSEGAAVVPAVSRAAVQAGGNPRRPPPPTKPNKLAELYQGGGEGGGVGATKPGRGGGSGNGGVAKDKMELQASIRSLKENNEALGDINRNLEEKLFQVRPYRASHLLLKPPIKDTLKEDKPPNKGQTKSTLHSFIQKRTTSLLRTKCWVPSVSIIRRFHCSQYGRS